MGQKVCRYTEPGNGPPGSSGIAQGFCGKGWQTAGKDGPRRVCTEQISPRDRPGGTPLRGVRHGILYSKRKVGSLVRSPVSAPKTEIYKQN